MEVNLHEAAVIRVEFTIHAPELPSPVVAGVDPSSVDPAWLAQRSDAEIGQLKRDAAEFIRKNFAIEMGETDRLIDADILFDSLESIRQPPTDTKLPPGCLLATVLIENPGPPEKLRIGFAARAQKRLLLSVSRPAAFPEVRDLAPGDHFDVTLPGRPAPLVEVERKPIGETTPWFFFVPPIVVAAIALLWVRRHGRQG